MSKDYPVGFKRPPTHSRFKKGKSGKAGISFFGFLACPTFMRTALLAGKLGSLSLVILARTFRKYGLTVSDNDPWGMIQKSADQEKWDPQAHMSAGVTGKPAYPGILHEKERKEL